jgi:hypothetical protein
MKESKMRGLEKQAYVEYRKKKQLELLERRKNGMPGIVNKMMPPNAKAEAKSHRTQSITLRNKFMKVTLPKINLEG